MNLKCEPLFFPPAARLRIVCSLVSRVSKTNAYEHVVLGTQSYKPREFATQVRCAFLLLLLLLLVQMCWDRFHGYVHIRK